jgi:tetratricopeptide (TPR) repeat protein
MHRYRTEQILGHFKDATTKYLGIRHLDVEPSPPILERINRMAAEDALYWTTLCKYELKEHATAIDLLLDYIRKYDRKGKWFFPARTLLAQCYADLDRIPEAMKTLEKTSSDDPYQDLNALRLKRWSASLGKTK